MTSLLKLQQQSHKEKQIDKIISHKKHVEDRSVETWVK